MIFCSSLAARDALLEESDRNFLASLANEEDDDIETNFNILLKVRVGAPCIVSLCLRTTFSRLSRTHRWPTSPSCQSRLSAQSCGAPVRPSISQL